MSNHDSVTASQDEGIDVNCTPCTAGAVSTNTATNSIEDEGFQVNAAAAGHVVANNRSRHNSDEGYDIFGTGILVTNNRAIANGGEDRDGYEVDGSGHTLEFNVARANHNDGFGIEGTGHTLVNNQAVANLEDGFDAEGDTITFTNNESRDNNATGFELDFGAAAPVTLTGNTSTRDRQAFCNDPGIVVVDGGGNNFAVGVGPACDAID